MSSFKCKMCGGTLEVQPGSTVAECEYCGTRQTLPKLDDERRTNLYDRAGHFRRNNDFDKAADIYEQILNEDSTDAEAYWSLVLCRYGIEYVEDPKAHKRIPTVNRVQFTSIYMDEDYKSALQYADGYQKLIYEEEAKAIDDIQKGILEISSKEEPFDVFICYKETDANGRRTQDSVLANDLYHELTEEGFKVFFSRITLEDKLGTAYEPYIFATLNSAKVMVVLGTKPEYFNAVWVKNEWSRYLSLVKKSNGKKMLIPAYRDMEPYDLPEEFSHLQAQDMSKLGFMQDLIRGIKKIIGATAPKQTVKEPVVTEEPDINVNISPLIKRAFMFCEDGEFDLADEYAEKVLDRDPENAEAYVVKLLVEQHLNKLEDLSTYNKPISESRNYQKAIRFATGEYKNSLVGFNNSIIERIENARKGKIYTKAVQLMDVHIYSEAIDVFATIIDFSDSKEQIQHCKDHLYSKAVQLMEVHKYDDAITFFNEVLSYKDSAQKIKECIEKKETERLEDLYEGAIRLLNYKKYDKAISAFETIIGYKDSKEQIQHCKDYKEIARKEDIYSQALARVQGKVNNDVALKASIKDLQSIGGYNDVDAQIEILNQRLEAFYADKKRAEEERKIQLEKRKKVAIKSVKIGAPLVALIIFLVFLFVLIIPTIQYNKADKLLKEGQFDEAMSVYQNLGDFSESQWHVTLLKGIKAVKNQDIESGISTILSVGVPVEITYDTNGGNLLSSTSEKFFDSSNSVTSSLSLYKNNENIINSSISFASEEKFIFESVEDFTGLKTSSRLGYSFEEWRATTLNYTQDKVFELSLLAVWDKNQYKITYNLNGGVNNTSNPTTYTIEDSIILQNPSKTGYTFTGWTNGGKIEKGTTGNLSFTAGWKAIEYSITYNLNGGTNNSGNPTTYTIEDSITLQNPSKTGYTFTGWSNGGKIEKGTTGNLSFTASWKAIEYSITYNLNGGTNNSGNPTTYTIEDSITLQNPSKTGYTFTGWSNGGKIEKGTTGNLSFTANWSITEYSITYNLNGGTNNTNNPSTYTVEDSITLQTPSKVTDVTTTTTTYLGNGNYSVEQLITAYTFLGWFTDESFENAITTISGTGAVVLYASWSENTTTTTTTIQAYSRDGNYIYFGSYPQTKVTDTTLTTSLNSLAGTLPTSSGSQKWTSYGYYISGSVTDYMWYIDVEYSGAKYRGVYFTNYRPCYCTSSSSSSNGYQYTNGYYTSTVYWFKYEPIKWQILEESNGYATILADLALDSQQYDYDGNYSNNYANSTIRAWLNDTFYNTAFNDLQKALIQTVTVDNSGSSTGYSLNSYACGNTNDKVWLLSYAETFSKYFSSNSARTKKSSDYAKSQGCWALTSSGYEGNCRWWLRSPHDYHSHFAWIVSYDGDLYGYCGVCYTDLGVVPSIRIKL